MKYFEKVRREELRGRPFAAAADMHGPAPVGAVLFHDQGNSPSKLHERPRLRRTHQAGDGGGPRRVLHASKVLAYEQTVVQIVGTVRDAILDVYKRVRRGVRREGRFPHSAMGRVRHDLGAHRLHGLGHLRWMGQQRSGLEADIDLVTRSTASVTSRGTRPRMQLFVDNIRAIAETIVPCTPPLSSRENFEEKSLEGTVGFYRVRRPGHRRGRQPITATAGLPRQPDRMQIEQVPYNVSNTDYFRDLRRSVVADRRGPRSTDRQKKLRSSTPSSSPTRLHGNPRAEEFREGRRATSS